MPTKTHTYTLISTCSIHNIDTFNFCRCKEILGSISNFALERSTNLKSQQHHVEHFQETNNSQIRIVKNIGFLHFNFFK
jgi:hypothetical protein